MAIIYELIQRFWGILCVGLQPVIVAFPGHTHLLLADICPVSELFSIVSSHALIQKIPSGGPETFFNHQRISQRAIWNSLEKQLDPLGPIAS